MTDKFDVCRCGLFRHQHESALYKNSIHALRCPKFVLASVPTVEEPKVVGGVPRPQCQCAERSEALKKAKEASARGDTEEAARLHAWVKQSLIDDALAVKAWAVDRAKWYAGLKG